MSGDACYSYPLNSNAIDRSRSMTRTLPFGTIRLIVITLVVLSQVYLFFRFRRVIRSSKLSRGFKYAALFTAGAVIVLLFLANRYIMITPIPWVDPPLIAQMILFYLPAVWAVGSIFAALVLSAIQITSLIGRIVVRLPGRSHGQSISVSVDIERRRVLKIGAGGLAAAPFLISGYGAAWAGRTFKVRELTLPFGRSLRVVQLTDIHAGIFMRKQEMRELADRVNSLQPDLFVLTGDYVTNSIEFLPGCVEEMARVRARYGTFACLGNHEHWHGDLDEIRAVFSEYKVPLLVNSHELVRTEQGVFAVAGIDDLRAGVPDLPAALRGLDQGIPTILLSHRPEIFPRAARGGVALTLSGHYHGGQVKLRLPGGDISMAHLVTEYPEGLYRIGDSQLYVSRGIGTTFTPIRLNVPPEITLLNLTSS